MQKVTQSGSPFFKAFGPDFDQNAIKAVKKYRFAPATLDGKPVPVKINIEVNFQIFP